MRDYILRLDTREKFTSFDALRGHAHPNIPNISSSSSQFDRPPFFVFFRVGRCRKYAVSKRSEFKMDGIESKSLWLIRNVLSLDRCVVNFKNV